MSDGVDRDTMSVGAVILAAGSSSRMGRPKQSLQFRDGSLLRRTVLAALGAKCAPVVVVTGAHAESSRREVLDLGVHEVFNPDWETGMASSIRAGLAELGGANARVDAAVFMVCDQPYVTADVISGLLAAHRSTRSIIVASSYDGGFGVPALFSRSLFGELARLDGGAGAKRVIESHASEAHFVAFVGGEVEVDTPDDFARLTSTDIDARRPSP